MSIVNAEKTANYISKWISDYATKAGAKALVLGLSGGIDSALVALLCKATKFPLVCVNMPCHSSASAFNRAEAFAKEQNIRLFKVDLSDAHKVINDQFNASGLNFQSDIPYDWESKGSAGALRSCLRAPTLSFLAHATNGIIMGTGNRSEDHITRYYQKFGDGCVDISPIADLFKSEVYELFEFLCQDKNGTMAPGAQAIYDAKPSADLWGADAGQEDEKELGISYDEEEWGDRENMRTEKKGYGIFKDKPGIIFDESDPAKHSAFVGYTARQKEVIAKMWSMEKSSRHKENPALPVCKVRDAGDMVK